MKELNIKNIIEQESPAFFSKPKWIQLLVTKTLSKVLRLNEINSFLKKNNDLKGIELIDELFEHLKFTFQVSNKDYTKIPSEGRIIIVANHPIGSLDGLSLIKTIYEIRKDVRIIANKVLSNFDNLNEFFVPVDVLGAKGSQRQVIEEIGKSLTNEEAVIIFPAGEVSRLRGITITDKKWSNGALFFAKKYNAPVLPVFIKAKNSILFYAISALNKGFSLFLLANELFNKRGKTINIKIGNPIPSKVFTQNIIKTSAQINLLKKHTYRIGKNKSEIFVTEKNVIHPVDKKSLYKEINQAELLGHTKDSKKIILAAYESAPTILREIARLRELTFRYVGEGTGKKQDTDRFDKYYKHIIVWDDEELEIVGSYRIGLGDEIVNNLGHNGFYSSTLFKFSSKFIADYLPHSLELGRSFVQRKYWNTNALHYLWLGLGAYLAYNPEIKYLFGPVSISNSYEQISKELLIKYFQKWFPGNSVLAKANNSVNISKETAETFDKNFNENDRKKEFKILKNLLKPLGFTVPVLYKHYSDLCEEGGVQFLDFSIDPDFENCVDGLILVQTEKLTEEKRNRYITPYKERKQSA
ncbi:MAG: lysophospholipid acyltransferase family protein [Melioribacteraceae bacterium]|nr:lysophospholipid acyltransferase family protein [Melioribacteraceae bacterium]